MRVCYFGSRSPDVAAMHATSVGIESVSKRATLHRLPLSTTLASPLSHTPAGSSFIPLHTPTPSTSHPGVV